MSTLPDWMQNPPESTEDKIALLKQKARLITSKGRKGRFLRSLFKEVKREYRDKQDIARGEEPLAFFKPSYDQALILNSWLYGIAFLCVYTANRIGKTTACIVNELMWIFPNKKSWRKQGVLRPYRVGEKGYDDINRNNPRKGHLVQVFPRPDIHYVDKIRRYLKTHSLHPDPMKQFYEQPNRDILQQMQKDIPNAFKSVFPYSPWNKGGTIWMGAPDHTHHKDIIMPLWREYLPKKSIEHYSAADREITFKVEGKKRTTVWEWIGKSYESKDTKWSSGAVDIIHLTEGVIPPILSEVKARFKDPGVGAHDFTPYEAANTGRATALAKRIKSGKEKLSIPYFVFEGFTVYDAPRHIISKKKFKGLIDAYGGTPEAVGRLEGKFWSSSMLVLSNFDRKISLLPFSKEELFRKFPDGRLYRGMDPGRDHPTSCAWALLTRQNQWIFYRIWAERGLDIPTRCRRIITLSNNAQHQVRYGPKPSDFYLVETHPHPTSENIIQTPTDFHMFKVDEVTDTPYANNYIVNGLYVTPSTHMGPEDRAITLNGQLLPSPFLPNLHQPIEKSTPPGAKVYFLKNEPGILAAALKWEDWYWERFKGGENKGEPTDKVPSHNDDELDSVCYLTCSNIVWTKFKPRARVVSSDPHEDIIQMAKKYRERTEGQMGFATIANQQHNSRSHVIVPTDREVVVFGGVGDGRSILSPSEVEIDMTRYEH